MKKIVTACVALILISVLALTLTACGDDKKLDNNTTRGDISSTARESTTRFANENDGRVSDVSGDGNGVAGDIVSDVSRGLTELSEALSEVF